MERGAVSSLVLPHTRISRELRYALRESRDFGKIYAIRCLSQASFASYSSNPSAKIEAWSLEMQNLEGSMAYLRQRKTGGKPVSIESEREKAVRRFLELNKLAK